MAKPLELDNLAMGCSKRCAGEGRRRTPNDNWQALIGGARDDVFAANVKAAIDNGSNMLNSATFYGLPPNSSVSLGQLNRFFEANPDYASRCFLGIKGATALPSREPDSSEEQLRLDVKMIKEKLGDVKRVDALIITRMDKRYPIETTMNIMKKLVEEGHFDYIGLSECGADTIRRAHKVAPVAFVELEYSYWSTDIERNGVLDACGELGIPILAYSPLGRGMFASNFDASTMDPNDRRAHMFDRFSKDNISANYAFAEKFKVMAAKLGITPVQLALAWLMQTKRATVVPLPGSSRVEGIQEALKAYEVQLDEATLRDIRSLIDSTTIQGGRYWAQHEQYLHSDTPAL